MGLFSKERLREFREREVNAEKTHTIMIVDDEDSNRRTLTNLLSEKYNLIEAKDGQEALDRIQKMPQPEVISLIISDQRMPRLTGTELFEKLVPVIPKTVRIILTGFADKKAIIDAAERGKVYKMVSKPFDRKDFLATVTRAIEVYESKQE